MAFEKENNMEQKILKTTKNAVDDLIKLALAGQSQLWVDYDKKADVLYVNFDKPQKADTAVEEEGIIKRTKNKKLVGITILEASRFI